MSFFIILRFPRFRRGVSLFQRTEFFICLCSRHVLRFLFGLESHVYLLYARPCFHAERHRAHTGTRKWEPNIKLRQIVWCGNSLELVTYIESHADSLESTATKFYMIPHSSYNDEHSLKKIHAWIFIERRIGVHLPYNYSYISTPWIMFRKLMNCSKIQTIEFGKFKRFKLLLCSDFDVWKRALILMQIFTHSLMAKFEIWGRLYDRWMALSSG